MTAATAFQYSHTLGFMANQGRGFNNPVDAAMDSSGALYVLNRAGPEVGIRLTYKRVTICTPEEEYLGEFGSGGTAAGQFWWPSSLAFDQADRLYIADEALDRISIFDRQGAFQGKWGASGAAAGELNRPSSIVFDREDNLLVSDSLNHRIQKFTKDGRFLAQWGQYGGGPGQFNMPWGLTVDSSGNCYVADWRNDRIQKFDSDGTFLSAFGSNGLGNASFHRPAGLAVDGEGNIYVADWGNQRAQVLDRKGRFLLNLSGDAVAPSQWAEEYLAANPDEAEARRHANLEPDIGGAPSLSGSDYAWERSANVEKLLWGPTSLLLDDAGRLYIVDSLRHRIQIYRQPT